MASTASLIASNATLTCGTLSINSARANVAASPIVTGRHGTARRCSLIAQAKPRMANTPSADCRFCMMDAAPFPDGVYNLIRSSPRKRGPSHWIYADTEMSEERRLSQTIMRRLDPRIHAAQSGSPHFTMDHRVKPGGDEE